jgi:hypothetical protein
VLKEMQDKQLMITWIILLAWLKINNMSEVAHFNRLKISPNLLKHIIRRLKIRPKFPQHNLSIAITYGCRPDKADLIFRL